MNTPEEKPFAVCRPTFLVAVPSIAASFAVAVLAGCFAFRYRDLPVPLAVSLAVMSVAVISIVAKAAKCAIAAIFCKYTFSADKVTVQRGLIATRSVSVKVADIRAIAVSRSVWGRILGYASAQIGTAATADAEISIQNVRGLDAIIAELERARRNPPRQ